MHYITPDRQPCQYPTTQFFTGRMPFLLPNQQCQSTEGRWSMKKILYVQTVKNRIGLQIPFLDIVSYFMRFWTSFASRHSYDSLHLLTSSSSCSSTGRHSNSTYALTHSNPLVLALLPETVAWVPWVPNYRRWWVYNGNQYQAGNRGITAENMEVTAYRFQRRYD